MRFRDMIRFRIARTAPDSPPRPRRARRPRTHLVESLEGRQLLSSLPPSGPTPEVASVSVPVMTNLAIEGERQALVVQIAAAVQEGGLAPIAYVPAGIAAQVTLPADVTTAWAGTEPGPELTAARGAIVTAARGFVSGVVTADAIPSKPANFGVHEAAGFAGFTSTIEAKLAGPPGPDGLASFLLSHGPGPDGLIGLPFFVFFRDQSPVPGTLRSDVADSLATRDPDVDLLTVSGDPRTSAPVMAEPRGEWIGGPRGHEDLAIIPVAGPGTAPGMLGGLAVRGGLAPPLATEAPLPLDPTEDDRPRDGSALADADGASAHEEAGLIDGAIADVEAALSRGADLLASFMPFDHAALERTIDRLLGEVGDLGAVLSNLEVTASLLPNLMAAAGAVAVFETVRRRVRGPSGEEEEDAAGDSDGGPPGLPGLPRGWALEEL